MSVRWLHFAVVSAVVSSIVACGGDDASIDEDSGLDAADLEETSVGEDSATPELDSSTDDAQPDAPADTAVDAPVDTKPSVPPATQLVTVEQAAARVMVFDYAAKDWSKSAWSWGPSDTSTIPSSRYSWYSNLSDAKYSKDGKRLLVAASGGGIAVIRLSDKHVDFYAQPGGNTHAIDELPDGNVVSASSTGGYLKVYATGGSFPVSASQTITFTDAHGVYWDGARKRLYACGGTALKAYEYNGNKSKPALTEVSSWSLPSGQSGAHDLFPVAGTDSLYLTNSSHIYEFDRTTNEFKGYSSGADRAHVKAIGKNPGSGTVVLMLPTESWWSDTILFDDPSDKRTRSGAKFYKVRWVAPTP